MCFRCKQTGGHLGKFMGSKTKKCAKKPENVDAGIDVFRPYYVNMQRGINSRTAHTLHLFFTEYHETSQDF